MLDLRYSEQLLTTCWHSTKDTFRPCCLFCAVVMALQCTKPGAGAHLVSVWPAASGQHLHAACLSPQSHPVPGRIRILQALLA
jgi:hypothetical protein